MNNIRKPKVGEKIYIPSSTFVYKGASDFSIGYESIDSIEYNKQMEKEDYNYTYISIIEVLNINQGAKYNWNWILENQEKWENIFKLKIA